MAADNFAKFGEAFQQSLARIILEDRSFADQIGEVLDYSFFELEYLRAFVRRLYAYKLKYRVHPSQQIMETVLKTELDDENDLVKATIWKYWEDGVVHVADSDKKNDEYIKENSLDFARKQKVKEAMIKSIDLLQKVKFDEIQQIISESLKAGAPADLGHLFIEDFEERYKENMRNAVSTGWPLVDKITGGGIGEGELAAFIAATGVGKSFCLVHVGAAALRTLRPGKTVVHYTLELSDKVIGKRYDSILSGVPLDSLDNMKDEVFGEISGVDNRLIIKQYNPNAASIVTLENHLNRLVQQNHDIGMIIVDYADKLKPVEKRSERYHELEDTYELLRGLASDMKVPSWTASQSNRCLDIATPVYVMRDGVRIISHMGDVKVGDMVETHKGWRPVVKVFGRQVQKTYKITLKSGKTMYCSAKHQFPTENMELVSIDDGLAVGTKLIVKQYDQKFAPYDESSSKRIREASGEVCSEDKLTAFLYLLMRDNVPVSVIAEYMNRVNQIESTVTFSNGWLAEYAAYVSDSLKRNDIRYCDEAQSTHSHVADIVERIYCVGERETVDITVDDTHMFYLANGVYTHNSGQYAELLTLESIAGAYAKAMPSDFIMTISRTLDECATNAGKSLIAKNRFGESNVVFPMFIDLSRSKLDVLNDNGVNGQDAAAAQKEMSKQASKLQADRLRDLYNNIKDK